MPARDSRRLEECQACGEPVEKGSRADGADLPLGEEAGSGEWAQATLEALGIVARLGEEPRPTAVAGEDEGSGRLDR